MPKYRVSTMLPFTSLFLLFITAVEIIYLTLALSKTNELEATKKGWSLLPVNDHFSRSRGAQQPKPMAQSSHARNSRLLVCILCSRESINKLGPTVLKTWANSKLSPFDFKFFVADADTFTASNVSSALEPHVVHINAKHSSDDNITISTTHHWTAVDEIELWKAVHEKLPRFKWYMKVEIDSYVNLNLLKEFVKELDVIPQAHYMGVPALEREQKGLKDKESHCSSTSYTISRDVLERLYGYKGLDDCVTSRHPSKIDSGIGVCIGQATENLSCQEVGTYLEILFSFSRNGGIEDDADYIGYSNPIFGSVFSSMLVHPIRQAKHVEQLHYQVERGLRPVFRSPYFGENRTSLVGGEERPPASNGFQQAAKMYREACVHNPMAHELLSRKQQKIQECPPIEATLPISTFSISTYVLNLKLRSERFEAIKERFQGTGLDLKRFEARNGHELYNESNVLPEIDWDSGKRQGTMSPGELGYRATMRALFTRAIDDDEHIILVLDDDAIPHDDFSNKLVALLNEPRCGGHLFSKFGGTLQLGSTIWKKDLWDMVSKEQEGARTRFNQKSQCFSSNPHTIGSFAVLYHRNVFKEIVNTLDFGPMMPFDWVFGDLARKGFVTRTAFPPIAIAGVFGASDVDTRRDITHDMFTRRAKRSRWPLSEFTKGQ